MAPIPNSPTPEEVLKAYWGYDSFRPMQSEIIHSVLEGRDTLGLMATGGGKSITFQVPALMLPGLTIVVTPLISLMKDQVDNLLDRGIRSYFLHSGLTRRESKLIYDKCRLGKAKILYVSPERLPAQSFIDNIRHLDVSLIVVDEAHCISQWGYDFRPAYLNIASLREFFPDAPVLALTASATEAVVADIAERLSFRPGANRFRLTFNRRNISYIVRHTDFKEREMVHILSRMPGCGIVYVRSRKRCSALCEELLRAGISASYYHAGLTPEEKNERQNLWKSDKVRIMVATTAFGMGIDKPDVRIVIHFDAPSSLEEYYQEAGRAGRDGLPSFAVSLVDERSDKGVLTRRLHDSFPPRDYITDIYARVCVFLDVAMGEGFQKVYDFDIARFCTRWKLQPMAAVSALRLLTRAGYLEYVDEVNTRARLMMLMSREELYSLRLNPECERVFNHILRNYSGIFADYEYIDESRIASELDLTERTIYENLLLLGRMHVLHFVPRSTTPYIHFPMSRVPQCDIVLPRSIYELRMKAMKERIEAMKQFLFSDSHCRVATLLNYFGEKTKGQCGTCDVCRASTPPAPASTLRRQQQEQSAPATILNLLRVNPAGFTAGEIALRGGIPPEIATPILRRLVDEEILHLDASTLIITLAR